MIDVPAQAPASMREQLQALMPYAIDRHIWMNGMIQIEFRIPYRQMLTFDFNEDYIINQGIGYSLWEDKPEIDFANPPIMIREPEYVNLTLTFYP